SNKSLSVNSASVSIDPNVLATIFNYGHFTLEAIPLPSVTGFPQSVDLDLTEFTVIGEYTHVYIIDNGKRISAPLPTVHTYSGKVKGDPGTLAFLAIEPNGSISGYIRFDNK